MSARRFKLLVDSVVGASVVGALHVAKRMDRRRTANLAGALTRTTGPWHPEHRIGRENLRAAFPEKSDAEIETILAGVWDNLGRVAAEFAHLDEFQFEGLGPPTRDTVHLPAETLERVARINAAGKPIIAFASHLANWELSALAAKLYGSRTAVLYRRPNVRAVGDVVTRLREPLMGELVRTTLDAPVKLARLLQSGVHVGALVDQHYTKGVAVTFFGRQCRANPLVAALARQTECPIHGMRVVRLPDRNSFWGEVTEAVEPARDAEGRIDIAGTMQAVTSVVEGWVRDHPEQWLWLHRRWR
jgi:Kdo2-lipid IVA lauroyltransferase/acyltransferase